MIVYFIAFAGLVALGALASIDRRAQRHAPVIAGVGLMLMAGMRGHWVDRDFEGYESLYLAVGSAARYAEHYRDLLDKDPSFVLVSLVVHYLLGDQVRFLFLIFAAFGVGTKLAAIRRLSPTPMLALIVYFPNYFLLQEMTTIRVGVACGFLLWSLTAVADRRPWRFAGFVALATSFHYSALLFTPVYLLDPRRLQPRLYIALLVGAVALPFTGMSFHRIFALMPGNPLTQRYYIYMSLWNAGVGAMPNLFNVVVLFGLGVSGIAIWKWRALATAGPYAIVAVKTYIWSLVVFYAFSDVGVLTFRFMEVFGVAQLVAVPLVAGLLRPRWLGGMAVVAVALAWLVFNLYYVRLVEPYWWQAAS